ncbi:hypothetical protein [Shewanella sp. T24-MNA-CIBAN-0130]|uniref:hypothetical protein n=1 Tax=Shewanella sp. T24-MNA-CIBAN-0130 TaxID=3140470 RepID=UPI0033182284
MSEQTTYEFYVAAQGDVLDQYISSRCRNTFIMGPIGSGKTYGSAMRVFNQMCEQKPNAFGIRKTRFIAVRNTYPDLKGTTIKDWCDLYHNDNCQLGKFNQDFPPTHYLDFDLDDGTRVKAELVFLALDRPDAVRKLRGLQATGFWLNEVKELAKPVVDMCDGRHGRYPSAIDGGASWHGMIGDTNAPDDDHWYYALAEETHPKDWLFLRQPGGVIDYQITIKDQIVTKWKPNPNAENLVNLPDGYYIKQVQGKGDDWIKVNLANQYGSVSTGMAIYQGQWNDVLHTTSLRLLPIKKHGKLLMGFDFGRTPACIIGQLTPQGQLRVIREFISENMGIRSFMDDLMPILRRDYPTFSKSEYEAYCDPSGIAKSGNDENSPIEILNMEYGINAYGTTSNKPDNRWEAVRFFLKSKIDNVCAFILGNECKTLRKGFNGGYQLRRIQVAGDARFTTAANKNKFSHPHDGLQYLAQGAQGEIDYESTEKIRQTAQQTAAADSTTGY